MNRSLLCIAALCFCTSASAKLVSFTIPDIKQIMPVAINENGQVTGTYEDKSFVTHGFLWQAGHPIVTFDVGFTGTRYTYPVAISPTGVITGWFTDGTQTGAFFRAPDGTVTTPYMRRSLGSAEFLGANRKGWTVGVSQRKRGGQSEAFLRSPSGKMKQIAVPGATGGVYPLVVNTHHTVAGGYNVSGNDASQAFVRTADGTVTVFGGPHTRWSVSGINDAGTVVGWTGDEPLGFFRTARGTVRRFEVPGAYLTEAFAINNSGTIAGTAAGNNLPWFGFLLAPDGTFTTVNPEGSIATSLVAINDNGMVAGFYVTADYKPHGFAGTP